MKRIAAYIGLALSMATSYSAVYAQQRIQFKVGYNTGMPVGGFKDFMGKNSYRGYHGELSIPLNRRLSVGLGVMYNDYYEKHPRQVYQTKDGTISAVLSNSIQTTPILIKANYEFTDGAFIRPYVGVGAGFNMISFAQYFGEFGERNNYFKPAVAAEGGINIPFNKVTRSTGISIGAHFNYLPFQKNQLDNLSNWGLHAGIFFPLK